MDAFAADAEEQLGDLLQVPFAPAALAWLAPGAPLLMPDLLGGGPVAPSPFDGVPPVVIGGGGDGGEPDDHPQPPGFVPDVPGSPTGSPSDTTTTGVLVPTGDGPGDLTGTVTGTVTDGSVFPPTTTVGASTSTGATPAPEPEMLWLVACGLAGLASRRLRK